MVVYEGQPGIECTAKSPESLLTGMNRFLKHLRITFRRDPNNYRPRINKKDSQKDKEQKTSGNYFFMEDLIVCLIKQEKIPMIWKQNTPFIKETK